MRSVVPLLLLLDHYLLCVFMSPPLPPFAALWHIFSVLSSHILRIVFFESFAHISVSCIDEEDKKTAQNIRDDFV